jgi:hypothetical protein
MSTDAPATFVNDSGHATAETATTTCRVTRRSAALAARLRDFIQHTLAVFPWQVVIEDWTGHSYSAGGTTPHWCPQPLRLTIKTEAAARALLAYNALTFLDKYLEGEVDMAGNLYLLPDIKNYARLNLKAVQMVPHLLLHKAFQNRRRARVNVQSHYDIPQEALDVYLDHTYRSYSCAMWEEPTQRERTALRGSTTRSIRSKKRSGGNIMMRWRTSIHGRERPCSMSAVATVGS